MRQELRSSDGGSAGAPVGMPLADQSLAATTHKTRPPLLKNSAPCLKTWREWMASRAPRAMAPYLAASAPTRGVTSVVRKAAKPEKAQDGPERWNRN
jgi:hypothetical protein